MGATGPLLARAAGRLLRTQGRAVAVEVAREAQRARASAKAAEPPIRQTPPTGVVAICVYYGWLVSLPALALVILNVDLLLAGAPRMALRLVLGSVLFAEGILLTSNWRHARTLLLARFSVRAHGHRTSRLGAKVWMSARATTLALIGLVLFGAGFFDLLRGAIAT